MSSRGRPTLKVINDWIDDQDDLPAPASKETVRRMLVGITVPLTWDIAHTVFLALCTMAGRDPDDQHRDDQGRPTEMTLRQTFHGLWQDALAAAQRPVR